ncbi:MAG TPA: 4-alpha-glucanotransferase [Acidothermaceae bacterium]|nr:4-alpha-glucanotransferase [Acidothermaceae bacterium]
MLDPSLADLAHAHGVATSFGDWRGGGAEASSEAVVAVLSAMGVDARGPDAIRASLDDARVASWRRMLPPCVVVRGGRSSTVWTHVPHGDPASVVLELEEGGRRELAQVMVWVDPREVDGALVGEATFEIPADLPLGYHRLRATSGDRRASCALIVVPDRLESPARRAWGFMLQLYAVRSKSSWGIGDFADLRTLVEWSAAELGAGFVLVNPLHAAQPAPPLEPSPYFPASRGFINPIYLRVEDVPEVATLRDVDVAAISAPLKEKNGVDEDIDRDAIWLAKREALEAAFAARRDAERQRAFAEFVEAGGEPLLDYATWCALVERHGSPWSDWPASLRDPRSSEVVDFRAAERELVDFHCWLQWQCAVQLDAVQQAARDAGMPIGVLLDLAVGSSPTGADAWSQQPVLAPGVSLGAPADMYNQQGQRWNLPTWQPEKLADEGFAPFRELVRASFAHGGGLRVDHIIGLFRQWWVRDGATPADSTYVRVDHEALVGIVLLEAARAGAVVVGEDLGNVEPWVRDYLRERGVFGTSILFFEHDEEGRPLPAERWRELCLATVTTHDLPPTAGYLEGEHVEIRAELGLLERDPAQERAADEAQRTAWIEQLAAVGLLDQRTADDVVTVPEPGSVSPRRAHYAARVDRHVDELVAALHGYVERTPARLIGVYLPDAVGDRRPVNQPGTIDEYPNWRVPMTDAKGRPVLLDDLISGRAGELAVRLAHVVGGEGVSVTVASVGDRPS